MKRLTEKEARRSIKQHDEKRSAEKEEDLFPDENDCSEMNVPKKSGIAENIKDKVATSNPKPSFPEPSFIFKPILTSEPAKKQTESVKIVLENNPAVKRPGGPLRPSRARNLCLAKPRGADLIKISVDACNRSEIIAPTKLEQKRISERGKQRDEYKLQENIFESCNKSELLMPPREERLSFNMPSTTSISIKGFKTLTHVSQVTGECSTGYTVEPARLGNKYRGVIAMRRTKPDPLSMRLNPAFLAQLAEECRGTDNFTLSSAGILFGAGLLSEYINFPGRGTMFQSFCTNRPTLRSGLGSNGKKLKGASSLITAKKLNEDSVLSEDGGAKIRRIKINHDAVTPIR